MLRSEAAMSFSSLNAGTMMEMITWLHVNDSAAVRDAETWLLLCLWLKSNAPVTVQLVRTDFDQVGLERPVRPRKPCGTIRNYRGNQQLTLITTSTGRGPIFAAQGATDFDQVGLESRSGQENRAELFETIVEINNLH